MTTSHVSVVGRRYFPNPTKMTPSGRVTRGRWTPARGVLARFVRDNRELAVLVATFALALVLGYATRGLAWV